MRKWAHDRRTYAGAILIIIIVVAIVVWSTSGTAPPSKVLKQTIIAANEGKYSVADENVLTAMRVPLQQTMLTSQAVWDSITKRRVKDIIIQGEEIHGESAVVRFSIEYSDGTSWQGSESLSKEDGRWKVSLLHLMNAGTFGGLRDSLRKDEP